MAPIVSDNMKGISCTRAVEVWIYFCQYVSRNFHGKLFTHALLVGQSETVVNAIYISEKFLRKFQPSSSFPILPKNSVQFRGKFDEISPRDDSVDCGASSCKHDQLVRSNHESENIDVNSPDSRSKNSSRDKSSCRKYLFLSLSLTTTL